MAFGIGGSHMDTDEPENARKALQREKSILQELVNGAENVHLVYLDRNFNFILVNEAYAQTCGYKPEEIIGKNHFALYPSEENEAIFKRVRDTGVPAEFHDKQFVFPDQPERGVTYWDWTLKPVKNEAGEVEGLVFSLVETTKRKKAEEETRNLAKFPSENPNPVLRVDKNGYFLYCNDAAKQCLKSSNPDIGEVIPESWSIFVDAAFASGKRQGFEEQIGGKTFIFAVSPVTDYVNFYGLDITERKKAEERLIQTQNRLAVATKAAKIGIHDYDIIANTVQWDKRIREIWGVEPDEPITYETFIDNVHPDDRAAVQAEMNKALDPKKGDIYAKYRVINRKDKKVRWVYATGKTFFDDNCNPARLIGTAEDITERMKTEELLRQQAQLLHLSYDAIIVWRKDGGIEQWNQGAEQLYGYTESEALGRVTHKLLKTIHPAPWSEIEAAMRKHGQWEGELRHYAKDGHEVTVSVRHQFVLGTDGIERIFETNRDITEHKKAEEELKKSEARYRSYIEVTGELGWTTNAEGKVIEDMPSWRNFTGQTFEEIKGSGWSKALHPDDLENVLRIWRQATKKKTKYEMEYRIRRHDGVYRYFLARGVPVFDEDKTVREWVGTCIDITARKKTEEVLREQNLAIESAPDAVISADNSFRIKSWNKAAESMFGWTSEEVTGKVTGEVFKPVSPTLSRITREEAMEQLMKSSLWKGEIIFHRKDGSSIPVSVSACVVKDENGEVSGMVAVVHDITKRIRRVKALREIQRDLKRAQAVARTGSWRIDVQRNILLWSDENHRIFGVPKGTPMTYETFLEKVHSDDKKYVDERWQAALRGEPYDIEHRIVVDGEVKWVRERAELEFDSNGTLQGGFGTTQEITDLVEMRQKLEDALAKVEVFANQMEDLAEEQAEKLKDAERLAAIGATAGMVGHDIRNPLQAIVGDLYLLECDLASTPEGEEKEGMKESLAAIKKSIDYINKIVQDLQDYARTIKPAVQETDLEKLCNEVLFKDDFPENIDGSYYVDEKAKKFITDPELLKRILTNLVNNALQAMPEGGKLEIHLRKEDDEVVLTVQDSGVGVTRENRDKLFTPLFTTKSKGQGFGLPVVKRMTEALGGTVTFESEEGKGTKFIVRLPATKK
jgi:PAS domain S-box-containing protein